MSNENKTSILITTHYVEEAQRAHVVALMRSGRLLVEQSPKYLMNYFKVDNLEDMFLRVCEAHDEWQISGKQVMPKSFVETIEEKKKTIMTVNKPEVQNLLLTANVCKRFLALTHKNYIRILRQPL